MATIKATLLFCLIAIIGLASSIPKLKRGPPSKLSQYDPWRSDEILDTVWIVSDSWQRAGEEWRLPKTFSPVSYNVRLTPFIEEGNFTTDGYVEMTVRCVESSASITFNSVDIVIDEESVTVEVEETGESLAVTGMTANTTYQQMTIQMSANLIPGTTYKISMKFVSVLNDLLKGFYRSSYVEDGVRKYLAVTDFESSDARRAFPCFDDPSMKAVFYVTLGRKDSMTSASNMPIKETIPMDGVNGYVWDIFEPTPIMSTYLVAFLVSEFVYVESDPSLSNVQFRVWSRRDLAGQLEYASNVGPRASEFLEEYFGIDYPIAKQDFAAIPDFTAGAMENWGLITYGESFMCYDPKKSTARDRELVTEVIAHELVHQWTGDLVTMDWWSAIWLNEGMARYFQYRTAATVDPDLGLYMQFTLKAMHPVMLRDSLPTSRPIYYPVYSPDDIDNVFDSITYDKGASIIRMMANFMGDDTFTRAMNLYLSRKAYGNANPDDLFQAMTDQANTENILLPASIKDLMDPWFNQMGFPLVTVTRNYDRAVVTITQDRFLRVPPDPSDTAVYRWWIPLTYATVRMEEPTFVWMSNNLQSMSVPIPAASATDYLLFNFDQKGYYRVLYDPTNYGLLRDQLIADHTKIPTLNRAELLDDAFNLALVDKVSYEVAFDLTTYLSKEQSFTPWHAVLPELDYIHSMFINGAFYGNWKRYMTSLVAPYYDFIGFEENAGDAHLTILSRSNSINWACRLAIDDCVQMSQLYYSAWTIHPADIEVISRNQKSTILCAGIENGNETDWEYGYNRFLNPQDPSENGAILNALGCTKITWLQSRLLDMMLDPTSGIAGQNAVSAFNSLTNNPTGNRVAFDFLRNNFAQLNEIYPGSMSSFFRTVSTKYNTALQLSQLTTLRDQYPEILGNSPVVDQAIATVQANIDWMDAHAQTINDWLAQH